MSYVVVCTRTNGTKEMFTHENEMVATAALAVAITSLDCAYAMIFRPEQLDSYLTRIEGETTAVATLLKCKPTEVADRVERLFAKMAEHDAAIKELKAKLKERP